MELRTEGRESSTAARTVFVLGGGGNLGAVQVGMLRALFEHGIRPDAIVGCSVGAINGAFLAGDPTMNGVERLSELWGKLTRDTLCPSGMVSSVMLMTRRGQSLHGNETLRALLAAALPIDCFEAAAVPLHVVATVLRTGLARWFTSGPVLDPVLASAALPAVLPPVLIEGELHLDGAIVDNVPIARALSLEPTRLVVLHVGNFHRDRPVPKRPIEMLVRAMTIGRNSRFGQDLDLVPSHVELILPPGIDPGRLRYNDFSRSAELIEVGARSTKRYLQASQELAFSA